MKTKILKCAMLFLSLYLFPHVIIGQENQSIDNLPHEAKRRLNTDARNIIERVWPKMQQVKGWKCDKYVSGSTSVMSLTQTQSNQNEIKVRIQGEFKVDRKGWGCFGGSNVAVSYEATGVISLNSGNIYIISLCYFDRSMTAHQSDCIAPADYGLDGLN